MKSQGHLQVRPLLKIVVRHLQVDLLILGLLVRTLVRDILEVPIHLMVYKGNQVIRMDPLAAIKVGHLDILEDLQHPIVLVQVVHLHMEGLMVLVQDLMRHLPIELWAIRGQVDHRLMEGLEDHLQVLHQEDHLQLDHLDRQVLQVLTTDQHQKFRNFRILSIKWKSVE